MEPCVVVQKILSNLFKSVRIAGTNGTLKQYFISIDLK